MTGTRINVCALAVALAATSAAAHGSIPNSHIAVVRPGTPSEIWIEATFGLAVSTDSGAHWDYICEEGVGYQNQASIRVAPSGRVFVATFDGLFISDDHGCSWSKNPLFADLSPSDVWLTPARPEVVYVTTARYRALNALFRSTNSGGTFQQTSLKDDKLFFSAVRSAPSNPDRVYVSAWWQVDTPTMKLFRSDDAAMTFSEIDLSHLPGGPGSFNVWAVHPTNPDVVFASMTQALSPWHTVVLRSTNGGASFDAVLDNEGVINALELSDDGHTVWVGTSTGLFRSEDGGANFQLLPSPQKNACAALAGSTLYVCGSQLKDGYALARSEDRGTTVTPALRLADIRGPLECPAGSSTHDVCTALWPAVKASFPVNEPPDAGTPGDGGTESDPPPQGCGCGQGPGAAVSLAVAIAVALSRRRLV